MTITRYIISAIQNDTEVNLKFVVALENFCKIKSAEMILIPTKYLGGLVDANWDERYHDRMIFNERKIGNNIKILGDLNLLSSLENPISGFDTIVAGRTVIVGHPQYQLKSIARNINKSPKLLSSTGAITNPNINPSTKAGKKAIQNHSFSAQYISVVNEGLDDEEFHIRCLSFDGVGFYDIDGYYSGRKFKKGVKIEGLVTGDEHVIEVSKDVADCVYRNTDSIVKSLRPTYIVRHDVFDAISVSHHAKGRTVLQNMMEKNGINDLETELKTTCEFIIATTPDYAKTLIVASNHNEHLDRWLQDPDSNLDKKNSKLYHWFMYQKSLDSNSSTGAFELYMKKFYPKAMSKIEFLDRDNSYQISDTEVHMHGDMGQSGTRGSLLSFSRYDTKVIVGHSHQCGVNKKAYQVGTSTGMKLSYTSGNTAWTNTMCIIYPNGERQLIHIINKKWFI